MAAPVLGSVPSPMEKLAPSSRLRLATTSVHGGVKASVPPTLHASSISPGRSSEPREGAVTAKGAKLSDDVLKKGADAKAKAEMAKDYRRHMLALTKTLLEVETLLMDDKLEEAKAELEKAVKMRDEGHKKMGVDDE